LTLYFQVDHLNELGPLMTRPPSIIWFRRDLRLDDNPTLHAALAHGKTVIPVFIWEPKAEGKWPIGRASRCWLHWSLKNLDASLRVVGSRLIIRHGNTLDNLLQLVDETRSSAVFWHRRYEPAITANDEKIEAALRTKGVTVETFNSLLLFEPWKIQTKSSTPYKVFTPYYRTCLALPEPPDPLNAPTAIGRPRTWPTSLKLEELRLLPRIPWDAGIRATWISGETAGNARFDEFLDDSLSGYLATRDRPSVPGTSRLSPYLHFGEVSPCRLWHTVRDVMNRTKHKGFRQAAEGFLRQLVWREFAHHLLFHFPYTASAPLDQTFERLPWRNDPQALRAWQRGQTGYPIVDAGMRQLWTTGWMHNRVRMLVGSFLVKDLLIPWQCGARWFWDTLVDADLANNTLGWQWVAGCGADAAPFFRIFNPVSQGERFDPKGEYVRKWVPELANVSNKWIHKPWKAPEAELLNAGVELGHSYPHPIVNHDEARKTALQLFRKLRSK
jgi:deoxyribodipyrimidine photo-lyase